MLLRAASLVFAVLCNALVNGDNHELGEASRLFSGPLEVVAEHEEFSWLESPLWSDAGNYLLFSDVKWTDEKNHTCGMIWRYDDDSGLSKLLQCSGLVGPGDPPTNLADFVEAGSNGLSWGWKGDGDLLVCQHAKHRIVRLNISDVDPNVLSISRDLVSVVVDSYNGTALNSPNDMVMDGDTLYFTDPPFGLQFFSAADAIANAFAVMPQDGIGVYTVTGDPNGTTVEPVRLLDFGKPNPWETPNGIAVTADGDVVLPITDFDDPRFQVYDASSDGSLNETPMRLESEFRIQGENSGLPALCDGVTYSPELDVIFGSGPGGVYIFDGTSYELLGFLRVDDLNSNNAIGGGYLWLTANMRLLRIPLASSDMPIADTPSPATSNDDTSVAKKEQGMAEKLLFLISFLLVSLLL